MYHYSGTYYTTVIQTYFIKILHTISWVHILNSGAQYLRVVSKNPASFYLSGTSHFEMVPRFLENLWASALCSFILSIELITYTRHYEMRQAKSQLINF